MPSSDRITSLETLPLVLRVDDLPPVLSIGKAAAYNLVRSGRIRSVRIGHRIRIPRSAVEEFLENTTT